MSINKLKEGRYAVDVWESYLKFIVAITTHVRSLSVVNVTQHRLAYT